MTRISLNTAAAATGLSKRTLWRYIRKGSLSAISAAVRGEKTTVDLKEVLALSTLSLEPQDRALIIAADRGDAGAQCDFALLLLEAQLPEEGVRWLEKAAQQFFPDAMYLLGRSLLAGEGVVTDVDKGLMWLSHAAAKGHQIAQSVLGFLQGPTGRALLAKGAWSDLGTRLDDVERKLLLKVLSETAAHR